MRLCYVVQRYGSHIAGGAEQFCREMAERMVARGHHIEVVTSCARSYVDWANEFEPGRTTLNGVVVHRLPVARPRDNVTFGDVNRRMVTGLGVRPLAVQREWMRAEGPYIRDLPQWLRANAHRFDLVVCFTYLYWTTYAALDTIAGIVPTVMHPLVHDEPPLRLSLFDAIFRAPDAFALATPEELELIRRRFRFEPDAEVVGIGVELGVHDPAPFRSAFLPDGAPYLLYVGRVDPMKGAAELLADFLAYKSRNPRDDLRLVFLGEALMEIPKRDDIVVTGFVDYALRDSAIAGCFALAMPSYFESFSMVLTETFAQARPALVQGRCAVLRGHAERSGAAIPYEGFAEFEVALEMLRDAPELADAMGAKGRAYVEREYRWGTVLERYEQLLARTAELHVSA